MPLTLQDWHKRYQLQAQWTQALRLYFFDLLKDHKISRILEIGAGTGALLPDLISLPLGQVHGADLCHDRMLIAAQNCANCFLTAGDVHQLPYADNSFDVVFSHYFLIWAGSPHHALAEMKRVTKNNGYLACFAEPDYSGRIDLPENLSQIKDLQITGLRKAGADPEFGRNLKILFNDLGLSDLECGVIQVPDNMDPLPVDLESEWEMIEHDLGKTVTRTALLELKEQDQKARKNGSRSIYVPTYYAWGRVTR